MNYARLTYNMELRELIRHKYFRLAGLLLLAWALLAYLVMPWLWREYFKHGRRHEAGNMVTRTADGHPGDPVNISIVGSKEHLIRSMTAAGWFPADPITFSTSVRIVVNTVFHKPDENAPVSSLFLFGRKQDMAFEQPVGNSPRKRHHVRFWQWEWQDEGRPVWFGAATFDEDVGLSHTTGQVTHHIGPDVDAERDMLSSQLLKSGWVEEIRYEEGGSRQGVNGGGDRWSSDGRFVIVYLKDKPVLEKSR